MLPPFGGLKCTSNWERSPGGESPELTVEDAPQHPSGLGTASGCHSVSRKVLLPVGANWQTFLFSKIESYFACCNTLTYNVLVKRCKLLGVTILGLLYDRTTEECESVQLILEVFVLHFVQEYGTLENSASQRRDEAIRRFVAARRNTHASSLLPAKLTHPLGQQQERGSSWCDPYSLTAKRARGWEGGAAEWWVERQQRIEEAFTAPAPGGDISLSTVQHPFIHH